MRRIPIFGKMPSLKEQIKIWVAKLKPDPYRGMDAKQRFERIHDENDWKDSESVSGPGSNEEQTKEVIRILEQVITSYSPKTIVDIPCGDFAWMQKVGMDGIQYIGGDIVPSLIEANQQRYGTESRTFQEIDLIQDALPSGDILLVRDCLVHLNTEQIKSVIRGVKKSSIHYLLTTTFTGKYVNHDIHTGDWRPLNLQLSPFNFPEPVEIFNENNTENDGKYSDKSLGLWKVTDLPNYE